MLKLQAKKLRNSSQYIQHIWLKLFSICCNFLLSIYFCIHIMINTCFYQAQYFLWHGNHFHAFSWKFCTSQVTLFFVTLNFLEWLLLRSTLCNLLQRKKSMKNLLLHLRIKVKLRRSTLTKYLNNLSKYFQWVLQPLQTVTNCRRNKLQNNSTHYSNYLTTYISLYFIVSLFHFIFHYLTTYITTYIVYIDR